MRWDLGPLTNGGMMKGWRELNWLRDCGGTGEFEGWMWPGDKDLQLAVIHCSI